MKKLLLFSMMVFAISSCSEKEQSLDPVVDSAKLTAKDVTIENGVLRFASKEHLKNVTSEISNIKEMENWYSNPEFTSLLKRQKNISREEYDKIGETGEFRELSDVLTFRGEGDDKILGKIVESSGFSAVLNSKSYVIVADSAYHIGATKVTSIHIGEDFNKLSSFLKNRNIPGAHTVEIGRVSLNNARIQSDFRNTKGNRRIYASNEIISFGALGYVRDVYIEYLKKNWIGWSRTQAPYLSFTLTGSSAPFGGQQYTYQDGGSNIEVIGVSGQVSGFGAGEVYNFKAHMYCITEYETFDRDF